MGKKKKYRGHYCWCCCCILPNEKFSGKGHARHLCKKCSRLGASELAFRQEERNMERCLTFEGRVRRKCRAQFARYLNHENTRVRALAHRIKEHAEALAEAEREWCREEERFMMGSAFKYEEHIQNDLNESVHDCIDEEDIPF